MNPEDDFFVMEDKMTKKKPKARKGDTALGKQALAEKAKGTFKNPRFEAYKARPTPKTRNTSKRVAGIAGELVGYEIDDALLLAYEAIYQIKGIVWTLKRCKSVAAAALNDTPDKAKGGK